MAESAFDAIMRLTGIPAIESALGVPATHYRNSDGEELSVIVVIGQEMFAVGDFGERMERRYTLEIQSASLAEVGDQFEVAATDATEDSTIWQASQLISDDGYMRKFGIVDTAA